MYFVDTYCKGCIRKERSEKVTVFSRCNCWVTWMLYDRLGKLEIGSYDGMDHEGKDRTARWTNLDKKWDRHEV